MRDDFRAPQEINGLFESLSLSPDPVFVTDRHNRIVFWNRSVERIFGHSAEEALGAPCHELLSGCDVHGNHYCSESCPIVQMAVRAEVIRRFNLWLRSKDQRLIEVDIDILHLVVPPPHRFFLAHILRPSGRTESPRLNDPTEPAPPPRSPLIAARESPDAFARKLTAREVEILSMLAAGHPTPEIAARLHISTLTARNHIQNVLDKLQVHSKAEAVSFAFRKGLL